MIADHDLAKKRFGPMIALRNVQLMKKKIYIPCVPPKNNCNNKKWFTRHETDRFLNNHCQECVRAYLSTMIIICCQIFCDLLLKSAFERIFNVMQLILFKIK
jgi:hypothetical protein